VQTKEGHASPAFLPEEFKYSVVEHPTANLTAWSEVPGVESLTVVLDGRMNGCDLVKEFPGLPMVDGLAATVCDTTAVVPFRVDLRE